jgi:hypothetical protein
MKYLLGFFLGILATAYAHEPADCVCPPPCPAIDPAVQAQVDAAMRAIEAAAAK